MGRGTSQPVTLLSQGVVTAIRVEMARRGIDQATLAETAGLSAAYLSRRMTLQAVLTLHDVERIAGALGVEPAQLIIDGEREAGVSRQREARRASSLAVGR